MIAWYDNDSYPKYLENNWGFNPFMRRTYPVDIAAIKPFTVNAVMRTVSSTPCWAACNQRKEKKLEERKKKQERKKGTPTDWLTDWMTDKLTEWLTEWVSDWVTHWVTHWLIDWLSDWLTEWRTDWLTDIPLWRWMPSDLLLLWL